MPEDEAAARLPHSPPARLVHSLRERTEGAVRCRAHIPLDSPWVRDGRAPAFVAIEIGAQATALLGAGGGPGPRAGYLVGARDARFPARSLPAGVDLEVEARDAGSAPPLRTCAIVVRGPDGVELATATVSVYATQSGG